MTNKSTFKQSSDKLILVVDDDPEIRELITTFLALDRPYSFTEADNGETGFEKARSMKPDLIITDIMMPRLNGYEMVARLQSDGEVSAIPIIMLTSLTHKSPQGDQAWGDRLHIAGFISKPFEPDELLRKVDAVFMQ